MDAQEGSHTCDPNHHRTTIEPPINPAAMDLKLELERKTAEAIRIVQAAGIALDDKFLQALPELVGNGATAEQWNYAASQAKRASNRNPGAYLVKVMRTELSKAEASKTPARADRFASRPADMMSKAEAHEWAGHYGIPRWNEEVAITKFCAKLQELYDATHAPQDCAVA